MDLDNKNGELGQEKHRPGSINSRYEFQTFPWKYIYLLKNFVILSLSRTDLLGFFPVKKNG